MSTMGRWAFPRNSQKYCTWPERRGAAAPDGVPAHPSFPRCPTAIPCHSARQARGDQPLLPPRLGEHQPHDQGGHRPGTWELHRTTPDPPGESQVHNGKRSGKAAFLPRLVLVHRQQVARLSGDRELGPSLVGKCSVRAVLRRQRQFMRDLQCQLPSMPHRPSNSSSACSRAT